MDLIEFLFARLDEDEAAALAATYERPVWRFDIHGVHQRGGLKIAEPHSWYIADHISRHDPARVLREVAAKRAMLAELTRWPFDYRPECDDTTRQFVRLLGSAWSDHPDYLDEWKP